MTKLKLQQAYFSQRTTPGSTTQPLVWFDALSMEIKASLCNALRDRIPCLHQIRATVSTPTRFAFGQCATERFALLASPHATSGGASDWQGHVIVGIPREWTIEQVLALESSVPWLQECPPKPSSGGGSASGVLPPLQLDSPAARDPQARERRLDASLIEQCSKFLYSGEDSRVCVVSDDFARIRASLDELLIGLTARGWRELSCSTLDGVSELCSTPYLVIGSTREIVDRLSGRAEWGILDADSGTLKLGQPASQAGPRAPLDWKESADEALQSSGAEVTDAPRMQDAQSQSGSLTAKIGEFFRGKPQSDAGTVPQGRAQDVRAAQPKLPPTPPTVNDLFRAARAGMESAIRTAHSMPGAPEPHALESQIGKSIESDLKAYLSAYPPQAGPPAMSRADAALDVIWHGPTVKDRDLHARLIALALAIEPALDLKATGLVEAILGHFRALPASAAAGFSRAGFISACVGRLADRFLEGGGTQNGVVELISALASEFLKQFDDRRTKESTDTASLGALYEIASLDLGDPEFVAFGQRAEAMADRIRLTMGGNRVTLNLLMRAVPRTLKKGLALAERTGPAGDVHTSAIDHLVADLRLSANLDSQVKIETTILLLSRYLRTEPRFVCPLLYEALRRHAGPSLTALEALIKGMEASPQLRTLKQPKRSPRVGAPAQD